MLGHGWGRFRRTLRPASCRRRSVTMATGEAAVETRYQRKSPREHILLRPEVYVGPIAVQERALWVWRHNSIVHDAISYVPALYKLFDEILVNAADNRCRDADTTHPMTYIDVRIDAADGAVSVENDGLALPVVMHATEKMYVPELLFGNLLTSSNYDDDAVRFTGGRHGYGAKLVNIFSREFVVELYDGDRSLEFRQRFTDNMSVRSAPDITERPRRPGESNSWTRITFVPDLARFGCCRLDEALLALMRRRVVDVAACHPHLQVVLDGERVRCASLADYIGLHDGLDPIEFTEAELGPRWRLAVGPSTTSRFHHASIVNNVATLAGGTHVDLVVGQVRAALVQTLGRDPDLAGVLAPAPHRIRDCLCLFLIGRTPNPEFESQSKERLTSVAPALKDDLTLPKALTTAISNNAAIMARLLETCDHSKARDLKKTDGRKRRQVFVAKLDDANWAGGKRSAECCLILTEGDSAKALAVSGLSVLGRDRFGVYPLRGKLLNVREATSSQLLKNKEFLAIKQILGLKSGRKYVSVGDLRYGQVMLMADQDHDGSHIKGLFVNVLHHFWPELLRLPGFLTQFVTPIVCARHKSETVQFFTLPEYHIWRQTHPKWRAKYYKGLGTSTSAEAKVYFNDLKRHRVEFECGAPEVDGDLIDLCFNKKRARDRKSWLHHLLPDTFLDYSKGRVTLSDFINKELILYSMADNVRSIPSMADGLKPGQRKILYACFKRRLVDEIKVAQLAGYVAEHTAYHHGETALCQSIVALAQDYVGSNNINLLEPNGQFGTRHAGGKDAASARYIFTCLSDSARALFPPDDDAVLQYAYDDGTRIEPRHFVSVIPMAIVNGSQGIGTGWSSKIPNHDPRQIIRALRRRIEHGESGAQLAPSYRGFQGEIVPQSTDSDGNVTCYLCIGCHNAVDADTVEVTELPVGRTTQSYKEFLDKQIAAGRLTSYTAHHTDSCVRFMLKLGDALCQIATADPLRLRRALRLTTSLPMTNMVLFDQAGALRRYASVGEIVDEFYEVRVELYRARKQQLEQSAAHDLELLQNRARFIQAVVDDELPIRNRSHADLVPDLDRLGFRQYDAGFAYLLAMPLSSLTAERVAALHAEFARAQARLDYLRKATPQALWLRDLDALETVLDCDEAAHADRTRSPQSLTIKRS